LILFFDADNYDFYDAHETYYFSFGKIKFLGE